MPLTYGACRCFALMDQLSSAIESPLMSERAR